MQPEQIEQLVIEYGSITELKNQTDARLAEIREALSSELAIGTHEIAARKVIIAVRNGLDKAAIAEAYPLANHLELYVTEVDTKAARNFIAPTDLKTKFSIPGPKTVTVR
jgi:hypothetical protein